MTRTAEAIAADLIAAHAEETERRLYEALNHHAGKDWYMRPITHRLHRMAYIDADIYKLDGRTILRMPSAHAWLEAARTAR